eukprot:7783210-Pyramimonas_sp.AAC.2
MLAGARWLLLEVKQILVEACLAHPDYKLIVTGHSLGAGIAVLVTMMLRELHLSKRFATADCVTFACPAWCALKARKRAELAGRVGARACWQRDAGAGEVVHELRDVRGERRGRRAAVLAGRAGRPSREHRQLAPLRRPLRGAAPVLHLRPLRLRQPHQGAPARRGKGRPLRLSLFCRSLSQS